MSNRHWMPLYVGDYLADTRHLTTTEHGAYLLLILHYWRTGGLPTEDVRLAQIAGMMHDEWFASRRVLSAFFDANWKHKRIEHELTEAARISAAGRKGGIASGKARKNRTTVRQSLNDPPTKREALQSQSQSHNSEAIASDASASPAARLWSDGVPSLVALGVSEGQARSMIGRWRRDTNEDDQRLLMVILRARDHAPFNPIPWITQALKEKPNGPETITAVAKRLAREGVSFGPKPGTVRHDAGGDDVRLLPKG